jgi:(heptosyl)LPS beta-1,4-glucosyltransferase
MPHLLSKLADYACATAAQDAAAGKKGGMARACLHAIGRFWQAYVYRRGFLDGARGLVLAALYSQYAFNKYAAMWVEGQPDPPSS